ncbi:mucin-5AC-like [Panicum virgatum]|uniref:mucin-5AC-like n=1 Tax=Panicum virgatum TaxID=38727 RepID=UPI0019D59E58|nr:mucin-5AC-like [Panicum virgatum]
MIEEICDVEFDETNGSQGEEFSCDDVGNEPLRKVMKNIAIGQVKPKEEVEELPNSSTQVEATSKDDSKVEEKSTPSHHHYESSDEEDVASHRPHNTQDEQVVEEQLPFEDTYITSEQAQARAQDTEPLEDSSSQSQERLTRTPRNHPIDLVMGDPSGPTAAKDASLAAAKAQLPHYLATDSEDSEDDEDYIPTVLVTRGAHDDETGPSSGARAPAPPVSAAQVTQPNSLAAILQRLTDQQDRFAAAQQSMAAEQACQREAQTLLQFDPTAPAPPAGGFVQTPLASFPMSPLLQTRVFASPAPTPTPVPQRSVMSAEQRAEFLRQQQVLHQLQHTSAQSLSFESPTQPEPIRSSAVRPTLPDSIPVTSAPRTDSVFVSEPAASTAPPTSAAPTTLVAQKSSTADDDWTDDDIDDTATQFTTGPSLRTPPSPTQD